MTLVERLRHALAAGHAQDTTLLTGDHVAGEPIDTGADIGAAVLVPVTDRDRPGVILTRRTDTLKRHAGQVAFPGGRIDPEDADAVAAALREAEEEIALPRDRVTVVGESDPYRTITGFRVTPVVAVVPPDLVLVPSAVEVAEVFEVPLDFLLDSGNHLEVAVEWQGHDRHYYEILWGGQRIWGATAAMIVNLSRRLRWAG
ncbi:CoA pyrophosphatase [Sphingomonas sp. H39-1-10]|uniref:CoA pyrophosphatase n=1 Tax=Sphingomonas TaxID=13687 RepID=UPI00089177B2|nr:MULTISPECIES: CoA pyrophosphatase [Sphingomonas]MDF0487201.1 CoA pyrophosphatase [Sphingomonas pollutisoli]SDA14062.1 NUDIX domain-containing protein [Sphingomonas sp. NFR15]